MLQILKASAGSGKTFHLSREYIHLLLQNRDLHGYRHILAVTFTNKATDEMKGRILKELHLLAKDPQRSPYVQDFVPSLYPDLTALQRAAEDRLCALLHDYTAFAVSTIDRFFQQTLRAFSREIGQFASYQVEIDKERLVEESVDRILDALTEDSKSLLDWLTESVMAGLMQGRRFHLESRLKTMASHLKSDSHEAAVEQYGIDEAEACSQAHLRRLKKACDAVSREFAGQLRDKAQAVLAVLDEAGIPPAESNRGFLKQLYTYTEMQRGMPIPAPTASFMDKAADSAKWFAKSKDRYRQQLEGVLDGPLNEFVAMFGQPYRVYRTAYLIEGQVYALGIAGELNREFQALQKERNVLSIDDSNTILRQIIDGSDAPFVYEKLGVRYENFLLDEFQDTSTVQWNNFRPLIRNSEAGGFANLIVGDVKQSIYRWRNSDWRLLGYRLQQDFPDAHVTVLGGNYRTLPGIVAFNNAFFPFAAAELDRLYGTEPDAADSISSIYRDVVQQPMIPDPAPGSVDVVFCEDQAEEIVEGIRSVIAAGGQHGDIAVLVRGNREGALIASLLIDRHIPVISDDAMYVTRSVTVRRLVSQLSLVDQSRQKGADHTARGFLARELHLHLPDGYHSLTDLSEALLRDLHAADAALFDGEIAYIQAFMDYLQDWTARNGHSLSAFLEDWETAALRISSPESGNSVRIMTIHKAKGLEFPYVIFPFAEEVALYQASPRWCRPAVEGTALSEAADGVYSVSLSGEDTLFAEDYRRERKLQFIDNLNIFYVALTRAQYGLKVISCLPPKPVLEGRQQDWKNLSQLLYAFVREPHPELSAFGSAAAETAFHLGVLYGFRGMDRKAAPERIPLGYPSFAVKDRLKVSPEAADFFGADGLAGAAAGGRLRGIVLHGILSQVLVPDDLPAAIQSACAEGLLSAEERAEAESLLASRIASVADRGWFDAGAEILNEVDIIDNDGTVYRPDRVVIRSGQVSIIDYKFGEEEPRYRTQVRKYREVFRRMGYEKAEAFLWYLRGNRIIPV